VSVDASSEVKSSASSSSSELSTAGENAESSYTSQDVDVILAADSDSCNTTDLFTAESPGDESANESLAVDGLESLSENSVDNEATELDMSFTETDNANTCLDDVTSLRVTTTTTTNGPPTSAVNNIDIKLSATADDVDVDDDHRHFHGSDRPCSDLKHDAQSILMSHVAMDIN